MSANQLSLFDVQFDARIRRVEFNGIIHFSILDTYLHYGKSSNPARDWKRDQVELEALGAVIPDLVVLHQFSGERQRKTPTATFKSFLRIAQVAKFKEWEPLRQWMAQVAHERIEEMVNPGLGVDRAEKRYIDLQQVRGMTKQQATEALKDRRDGKANFVALTDAIKTACSDQPKYWEIVDAEYMGIFGKVADELKIILNTKSVRDDLPAIQYSYVRTAELELRQLLTMQGSMTNEQIIKAARMICDPLGEHLVTICDILEIDHITGRKLIKEGRKQS